MNSIERKLKEAGAAMAAEPAIAAPAKARAQAARLKTFGWVIGKSPEVRMSPGK
jgi:hypothetical protein